MDIRNRSLKVNGSRRTLSALSTNRMKKGTKSAFRGVTWMAGDGRAGERAAMRKEEDTM